MHFFYFFKLMLKFEFSILLLIGGPSDVNSAGFSANDSLDISGSQVWFSAFLFLILFTSLTLPVDVGKFFSIEQRNRKKISQHFEFNLKLSIPKLLYLTFGNNLFEISVKLFHSYNIWASIIFFASILNEVNLKISLKNEQYLFKRNWSFAINFLNFVNNYN